MRQLRVIYNPLSGQGKFPARLDDLAALAQRHGYRVSLYRLTGDNRQDCEKMLAGTSDQSVLVVAGGDGTMQMVVDTQVKCQLDLPIALMPYGTSNDFADFVGLDTNPANIFSNMEDGKSTRIDIGTADGTCFVNVFSAGQLTKTSHGVDRHFKNQLGMLAYYLHGVGNLPRISPFEVTLKGDLEGTLSCLLLLTVNGGSAGGFKNMAPRASLTDGLLETIIVRECSLAEMAGVFWSVLRGEYSNNPSVIYARTANLEVQGPEHIDTDVDGERGPAMPLKVGILPRRIQLLGAEPQNRREGKM